MNVYESLVAQHIQAMEKLLQESLDWEADLASAPAQARNRHNQWADLRQPLFVQHLQQARDGLITSSALTKRKNPKARVVEAWTPAAVAADHEYVLETDHSRSKVGPVFARQAGERLQELEQAWDAQMGRLYELSRR